MSIASVVTRGFGNGTFNGTIPFAVTAGYDIGELVVTPTSSFAVYGGIKERGLSVLSAISENGQGSIGSIFNSFSVISSIQERGKSVTGLIDETGQGVTGEI